MAGINYKSKKFAEILEIVDNHSIQPSVIIPTIGRDETLPDTLKSLWNQTLQPREIIVAHDSELPSDKIKSICEKHNSAYLHVGQYLRAYFEHGC